MAHVLMSGLALVIAASTSVSAAGVPLIIDTDASFDVDDVVAVCMAHALMDRGEVDIKVMKLMIMMMMIMMMMMTIMMMMIMMMIMMMMMMMMMMIMMMMTSRRSCTMPGYLKVSGPCLSSTTTTATTMFCWVLTK